MPDNIRSFRAASVADALAQIRREMGHEAVVVETKQLARRGLFSWFAAQAEVQVTASVATSLNGAKSGRRSARPSPAAATRPRIIPPTTQGTVAATAAQARRSAATPTLPPLDRTPQPLQSGEEIQQETPSRTHSRSPQAVPTHNRLVARRFDSSLNATTAAVSSPEASPESASFNVSRSAVEAPLTLALSPTKLVERGQEQSPATRGHFDLNQASDSPPTDFPHTDLPPTGSPNTDIEQRLDSLHKMIAELGRQTRPRGLVEIPPGLFAHYLALIEGDVEDEIARELIAKLQQHATPEQLDNTASTTSLLTALVEREIHCTEPLLPKRGYRRVAMLVGPTGVGKTTTIAKLAGRFGLEGDLRVGLITVDTYRVAAVDQLRTYAEIIDLPLQVVSSPEELPAALARFAEFDLVLIDTAGRSPHDDRQLEELKQLVAAATPDDICLVLSLASGARSLRATADRFAAVRPTSLILTKLDEAAGCGGLLSVSRDIAIPISYFTLGQEVPRDIEPANACRAARLVLGRDRLGHQPEA